MTKFIEQEREWRGGTEVLVYETQVPTQRARFALELIERFALIAGEANGEDTAGRQKLRLMTPKEIVDRACQISEAAFSEFEKQGWVIALPDIKPSPPRSSRKEEAA